VSVRSYRRSPDVLWRNVGPEVILTRPKTETIAELSESGAEVWRLLEEPRTVRGIAAGLDGFAQEGGNIEADVKALLDDLVWRGYCTRGDR
jgi:Coenzyme PQQ synthesis protein D (PqqD)